MKHFISSALCAAAILSGSAAYAADQMSSDSSMSHSKMMKDCMAKQKAKDSSMSKDDMMKACKSEMKMGSDHSMEPADASKPPSPTTEGSPNPATATPPPK